MIIPAGKERKHSPDPFLVRQALQALVAARRISDCAVHADLVQNFTNCALFPEEAAAVAKAAPARLLTFRAGRGCARAALKQLGCTEVAIPMGLSGAPMWPLGFVGSIAHTNEIAVAIVAASKAVKGLGLDIETDEPLDNATMAQIVCRPEELIERSDAAAPPNLRRGKLIFVIKEAIYKLYQPLSGAFLEFNDLAVSLDETAGTFRAGLTNPERPAVDSVRAFTGVFAASQGLIIALTSLD